MKERGFGRNGGSGILPPHSHRTLHWATRGKLRPLAMHTAKLYFVVLIFLFYCVLRTLGMERGSSVVGFG